MLGRPISPQTFVVAARVALAPVALLLLATAVADGPPAACALLTFALVLVLLIAFPARRQVELMAALMIALTGAEWLLACVSGTWHISRWSCAIAIAGGTWFVLRINYLRSLARQDPYVSLRQLDRRNATLGRTFRHHRTIQAPAPEVVEQRPLPCIRKA